MRAHLLHAPADDALTTLRSSLPASVTLGMGRPVSPDADILVAGVPSAADLDASSRLSALVIPYAGLPTSTRALLAERPGLSVYNLHHNAPAVAEMALALLLAVTRHLLPMDRQLRDFSWRGRYLPDPAFTLSGRTVLILGFGAIGRRLAPPLLALGARVSATRRRIDTPADEGGVSVYPADRLDDLLAAADAVVVALSHTDETSGLLGARRLALLPRGAALVNVARAKIIDEQALYDALASGQLCGAGLDVWYRYPRGVIGQADTPPCDAPLWELPNVVFSPHRAGHVRDTEEARMRALAAVLADLAEGRPAPGRVRVAAGY
jgi:phosphoglycerate dehydrogenase-like enzyme